MVKNPSLTRASEVSNKPPGRWARGRRRGEIGGGRSKIIEPGEAHSVFMCHQACTTELLRFQFFRPPPQWGDWI